MATILLSAAGAAVGGAIGGSVAGLSSVAIGRAVGATLGKAIDEQLLGQGADPVDVGRIERFRLTDAADGAAIAQIYGRMRVGGQVIWASDFQETVTTTGGGKGSPSTPQTRQYSYSVSLAIALCEGEITGVRRVWADGEEVATTDLNMRVYSGSRDQLPDPVMEAVEGAGQVPAYRGTAYVVFEDLGLDAFGGRVPQFSFEVVRPSQPETPGHETDLSDLVRGVALIPGTGEYALATTPVYYQGGPGSQWPANLNAPSGATDFVNAVDALVDELPNCGTSALVVSWFGNDLRCGTCDLRPKIERRTQDGRNMPWRVSGLTRSTADEIARVDDRPIYGGSPADAAVVEAIQHLRSAGQDVVFYPFVLMEQQDGNDLPDPWTGETGQPAFPWRGRITLSVAPGQPGSPDGTAQADAEVAAFFGQAQAEDFTITNGVVTYSGPDEWGLRRFILHYAALCAAAGGVTAFCIGSELRGLTQIRGAQGFAAVAALRDLAADVRAILGPETKIGYAADWSEYFGYQPADGSGDRFFHLDPLWADEAIDFIGIDNYMPLSDWRDGADHADAGYGSIYDAAYLDGNVEGGEGYDWYYHSTEAAEAQIRTPITDDAYGEPWVWRYKDIRNWWANPHHDRIGGVRQDTPTDWVPGSKPIWFTELGCAAVDKGANEPNAFADPKSSESRLPRASNGLRDDLIQRRYIETVLSHWDDPARNPVSAIYGGRMIDTDRTCIWAWDTRPFPSFPNNRTLWSDGENYARGHWVSGRSGGRSLALVVGEICERAGLTAYDTSGLHGFLHGYVVDQVGDARSALQPLMVRFGFDAVERDGVLKFTMRGDGQPVALTADQLAETNEIEGRLDLVRAPDAELAGRVRLRFVEAEADHAVIAEEAVLPDEASHAVAASEVPLAMTRGQGRQVAERWLAEARIARDTARFALPPSQLSLGAGDVVQLPGVTKDHLYRIDRVEQAELQLIEAVRIQPSVYTPTALSEVAPPQGEFVPPVPVLPLFLDLPLLTGDEVPHAPHLAVTGQPWPGSVSVYASASDSDFALSEVIAARSVIGVTENTLASAPPGIWDRGAPLRVRLVHGALESRGPEAVLGGANLAAIGDGSSGLWEVFQFTAADMVAPETFELSGRLRGQAGSDGVMPQTWPEGAWVVLLNGLPAQIDLASSQRRLARYFRIGPARRGFDDPSYTALVEAFDGNGLRPYRPCHLVPEVLPDGDLTLSWIRRTRVDGDSWDLDEVPLGEESERYLVRVRDGAAVLRETTVYETHWTYTQAQRLADAPGPGAVLEVAQVSARFGPGPFASVTLTAIG